MAGNLGSPKTDPGSYLDRIGYKERVRADLKTLRGLQLSHLLTVPFENLDIGAGRDIVLTHEALWNKIIVKQRGGFCYELNGLFAWLLEESGFRVTHLNARDYHEESDSFGIDFDHLALLVQIPGDSRRWLADVGYGDTFVLPLDIDERDEQVQGQRGYQLEPFRGGYQLWQRTPDGKKERQYFFDLTAHNFPAEYESTCYYHQTSPHSIFTQKRIISRLTPNGRVSITDREFLLTENGVKTRRLLQDDDEIRRSMRENFGFSL